MALNDFVNRLTKRSGSGSASSASSTKTKKDSDSSTRSHSDQRATSRYQCQIILTYPPPHITSHHQS
ncbi:hypothetical protein DM01DRAFT_1377436 [Hesseltinella vesiculosa]|uniref:Uncharacterized protein n=1 Tax=Hesseltinella vesiculosa TaxID=101127 RepID=A0A1X2G7K0_9FUNG|nr:hypothetical protein DM01DRAFT_1377434 [Hesseltinella vesiculosa]ORX47041.1 hypothetical protein DM01DRAFT_1377436 [Hesseltinella vesiculosa]